MKLTLLLALLLPSIAQAKGATLKGRVKAPGQAIVYVTGFTRPAPQKTVEVMQKDERFDPGFVAIVQGQSVSFVNRDAKAHNVFSSSEARKFDLGTNEPGVEAKVTFPEAGLVDVFCNIHPEMEARVVVLPNTAYSVTGKNGEYRITGIPAGKHKVFAWHPRGQPVSKEIEFKEGEAQTLDWEPKLGEQTRPHLNKYGRPYRERKKY